MAPAKLETKLHLKAVADKIYDGVSVKACQFPNISPLIVKKSVLLHGEWGKKGSIIYWNFVDDAGKLNDVKHVIEEADRNNRTITCKVVEGHLLEAYKNFKFTVKVATEKDGESLVHLHLEYEKIQDDVSDPYRVMYVFIQLAKDIEYRQLLKC